LGGFNAGSGPVRSSSAQTSAESADETLLDKSIPGGTLAINYSSLFVDYYTNLALHAHDVLLAVSFPNVALQGFLVFADKLSVNPSLWSIILASRLTIVLMLQPVSPT
jgi:hypothetical protein